MDSAVGAQRYMSSSGVAQLATDYEIDGSSNRFANPWLKNLSSDSFLRTSHPIGPIMFTLDVLSRIIHVGTAITLVGGSAFMLIVLLPSAKLISDEAHQTLAQAVTGRWKRFIHGGILLFLLSGFYNYMRAIPNHKGDGLYHGLLGVKMLLAFTIFFLASALVGRSAAFEGIRQNRAKWLKVIVLFAAIIVGISGFVKVRGPSINTVDANAVAPIDSSDTPEPQPATAE
ncbi:hypothetical protein [Rhodopirellula bahusiensis]|uniref:hypothetical protein n=1 Tax=Rhodopirellula bahusiensis TaxID=2014065 RepID=UPI001E606BC1|nr:hypothetical protein [Rhodopirellula bahusiensis]